MERGARAKPAQWALAWIAVALWTALIWSLGGDTFSDVRTSRFLGPLLSWLFPEIAAETIAAVQWWIRKAAHAAEYGVLALLAWRAARLSGAAAPLAALGLAFAVVLGVAISDEGRQSRSSQRTGTLRDVMLDLSGGGIALVGLALLPSAWQHRLVHPRGRHSGRAD